MRNILLTLLLIFPAQQLLAKNVRIVVPSSQNSSLENAELLAEYKQFNLYNMSTEKYSLLKRNGVKSINLVPTTIDFDALKIDTTNQLAFFNQIPQEYQMQFTEDSALHLIQFIGPIKDEWLEQINKSGAQLVHYVRNNAYLVWANARQREVFSNMVANTNNLLTFSEFYQPYLKMDATIRSLLSSPAFDANQQIRVSLQIFNHTEKHITKSLIESITHEVISPWQALLNYENITISLAAGDIETLLHLSDVYSVHQYFDRELNDEVQGQIIAGNFNVAQSGPSAPGYLTWLNSYGFSTNPADYPIVDVVDDGIGDGSTTNGAGDATLTLNGDGVTTRLDHVDNCTAAASGEGVGGHGHINTNIVGGFDQTAGFPFTDPNGYLRGQGINPYARIAGTRIFGPGFDLSACGGTDTGLIKSQQDSGSVISSNSWGCSGCAGSYDTSSQAFDVGVRDADLTEAGNQQLIMLFAAGNSGTGAGTVGTPGNGKNMITVGASENQRPNDEDGAWTDGCGTGPTGADNAMDVIGFSSRGPAPGNRTKPEVIAPGTHIQGTASTNGAYNGSSVCDQFRPSAQTVFASSSGTSHSTPALSGVASLYYYRLQNTHAIAAPTPSLMKAFMIAHPTYLTGVSANDNLPSNNQGYGMPNMTTAFDSSERIIENEITTFANTGDNWTWVGAVADNTKPVRIVMTYTDAAGATGTSPEVNNLDLSATIGGSSYVGNNFTGQFSVTGGTADPDNNYEAIFLPVGTSGAINIDITAANIAGDGVPNNADSTDQDFSLVCYNCVSQPTFTLAANDLSIDVCVDQPTVDVTNDIISTSILGFVTPIDLTNNPALVAGMSGVFATTPLTPGDTTVHTVTVADTVVAGTYPIVVEGVAGADTRQASFDIVVSTQNASAVTLSSPADGATGVSAAPTLNWSTDPDATSYTVEIADSAAFSTIVYTQTVSSNSHTLTSSLNPNTEYFWRVTSNNICGGNVSSIFSFTTVNEVCFSTLTAIPDNSAAGVTTTINLGASGNLTNLLVKAEASHTFVGDLIFSLEHNGTTVVLMDRPGVPGTTFGCSSNDVNTLFDDTSANIVEDQCNAAPPAIGPNSNPQQALSGFNGLDQSGDWNLTVSDNATQDTGSIVEWCLLPTVDVGNSPADAVDDAETVDEDSGANTIDVLVNDSDPESDPFVVISKTDGTNGIVAITNAGADVSYTPDADYCGVDTFTYTITGGDTATVTMDVTCVNDQPTFLSDTDVYFAIQDIGSLPTENVACDFDFGPDDEDLSQSVNDFAVAIDSDTSGIINSIDVQVDGSIVADLSGNNGVATISIIMQDDGGTANGGVDNSVAHQVNVHVQDYIFRNGFDVETCQ